VSFKPGPEDCYGRCGSDRIWQTVPDTCSGDRESSVTDGKESGAADEHKPFKQLDIVPNCISFTGTHTDF